MSLLSATESRSKHMSHFIDDILSVECSKSFFSPTYRSSVNKFTDIKNQDGTSGMEKNSVVITAEVVSHSSIDCSGI